MAVQGDWKAYRSRKPWAKGWEPGFADAVAAAAIDPVDPVTPVPDFTREELLQAVHQGKRGKSTGPDQVPHELLVGG